MWDGKNVQYLNTLMLKDVTNARAIIILQRTAQER